jgi:hypothetical protein
MQRPCLCYDIETSPIDETELREFYSEDSIELPRDPGEFSIASVAVGHLKDPVKISAKIGEAREKHMSKRRDFGVEIQKAKDASWQEFIAKAPLSAVYGKVVAIGYGLHDPGRPDEPLQVAIDIDEEPSVLDAFVQLEGHVFNNNGVLIGHNTAKFDLPFIVRRCWANDIDFSFPITRFKSPKDNHLDTLVRFACGDNRTYVKLDDLARMLRVPGKDKNLTGDQFWVALRDGRQDEAIHYLESDIVATFHCARKMRLTT